MQTGGRVVRSEKLCHKNAIKHEKGGPNRFSDKPKYPPQKNLAKTQGPPLLDFQLLCDGGGGGREMAVTTKRKHCSKSK
jgi:hypothetical protein